MSSPGSDQSGRRHGPLTQTAEPARAILVVETIDVVADRGYFKIEDIKACEKAGMTPCVPKPQRGSSVSNGFSARMSSATRGARRIHRSGREFEPTTDQRALVQNAAAFGINQADIAKS
jgi:IS5 family transposase